MEKKAEEAMVPATDMRDLEATRRKHTVLAVGPERRFNLLSICSLGIVTANSWAALGGTVVRICVLVGCFKTDVYPKDHCYL